jgi:hypothetical protein
MATAELIGMRARRIGDRLCQTWPTAYAAIWLSTLTSALVVAGLGRGVGARVRDLVGARLDPVGNGSRTLDRVLSLAAHNFPIVAWPLLLGVMGAHHNRLGRFSADVAVLASALVNTASTGAAIGAYGARLLPFIPQLPLEWAALALGVSAWLMQRRRALLVGEALGLLLLMAAMLLAAAVPETFMVPHR